MPGAEGQEEAEGSRAPPIRRRATVTASLHGAPSHAGDQGSPCASPERYVGRVSPAACALGQEGPWGGARKSLASARSLSPLSKLAQLQLEGAEGLDAGGLQGGMRCREVSTVLMQRQPLLPSPLAYPRCWRR